MRSAAEGRQCPWPWPRSGGRACGAVVRDKRCAPRRVVAQLVHLPTHALDDVEATLVAREDMIVNEIRAKGRPTLAIWESGRA